MFRSSWKKRKEKDVMLTVIYIPWKYIHEGPKVLFANYLYFHKLHMTLVQHISLLSKSLMQEWVNLHLHSFIPFNGKLLSSLPLSVHPCLWFKCILKGIIKTRGRHFCSLIHKLQTKHGVSSFVFVTNPTFFLWICTSKTASTNVKPVCKLFYYSVCKRDRAGQE